MAGCRRAPGCNWLKMRMLQIKKSLRMKRIPNAPTALRKKMRARVMPTVKMIAMRSAVMLLASHSCPRRVRVGTNSRRRPSKRIEKLSCQGRSPKRQAHLKAAVLSHHSLTEDAE